MKQTPYTDDMLIAMILRGGKARDEALKFIYLAWYDQAKGKIIRSGCQAADVNGIIKDSVMALDENVRSGKYTKREGVPLISYYLEICFRKCRNNISSQKPNYPIPSGLPEPGKDPERTVISEEEKALVRKALGEMGEKCRKALLMWGERYPLNEIAEALNTTYDYTRTLLFKCRNQLGEKLRQFGLDR